MTVDELGLWVIAGFLLLLASYWVYKDASERKMSAVGWSLGTFLMFIIVFPAYLVVRSSANRKKCPECKASIPVDARKCMRCGSDVEKKYDLREYKTLLDRGEITEEEYKAVVEMAAIQKR
ncbi:MAG: hypothetical protein AB2L14_35465 [Candidatus Xenobiia bacterium LiM19]